MHLLQQIGEGLPGRQKKRRRSVEIKTKESHPHHEQSYRREARGSMALAKKEAYAPTALREQQASRRAREKTSRKKEPLVSWEQLVWAILHCFLRGWNAQWEGWRVITSEQVGPFAAVRVCDQAIDHRIERAETWMCWTCEQVSAWLSTRRMRWEDRSLAPWNV